MASGGFRARPSRKAGSFAGRVARQMLAKESLEAQNDNFSAALVKRAQRWEELKVEAERGLQPC